MKTSWLNKQNKKSLIVFLAGWSFDENPFKTLEAYDYDVLFVYDYNDMEIPKEFETFNNYENKILIAWSMGVYVAFKLRNLFDNFDKKIAINGTVTPVDDNFGIPVKIFELTLKHAQKGLEGKFYQNVFLNQVEYEKYIKNPVQRPIENRVSELENLYSLIKNDSCKKAEKFYDYALVSEYDRIIPTQNQNESHKRNLTQVITLPFGHNPFYNFNDWDEITKCKQTIKQ